MEDKNDRIDGTRAQMIAQNNPSDFRKAKATSLYTKEAIPTRGEQAKTVDNRFCDAKSPKQRAAGEDLPSTHGDYATGRESAG